MRSIDKLRGFFDKIQVRAVPNLLHCVACLMRPNVVIGIVGALKVFCVDLGVRFVVPSRPQNRICRSVVGGAGLHQLLVYVAAAGRTSRRTTGRTSGCPIQGVLLNLIGPFPLVPRIFNGLPVQLVLPLLVIPLVLELVPADPIVPFRLIPVVVDLVPVQAILEAAVSVPLAQGVLVHSVVVAFQPLEQAQPLNIGVEVIHVHGIGQLLKLRNLVAELLHIVFIGSLGRRRGIGGGQTAGAGRHLAQGILHGPLSFPGVGLLVLLVQGVLGVVVREGGAVHDSGQHLVDLVLILAGVAGGASILIPGLDVLAPVAAAGVVVLGPDALHRRVGGVHPGLVAVLVGLVPLVPVLFGQGVVLVAHEKGVRARGVVPLIILFRCHS